MTCGGRYYINAKKNLLNWKLHEKPIVNCSEVQNACLLIVHYNSAFKKLLKSSDPMYKPCLIFLWSDLHPHFHFLKQYIYETQFSLITRQATHNMGMQYDIGP